MNLLIVHNDYGKYSGEEAVVDGMSAAFAARGVHVDQLRLTSAGSRESLLGQAKGFVSGIYSHSGVRAMRDALQRYKPDVVNVHNLYPFISPAALQECRKAGVPVVMTVHNFRLVCPTGLFMRDGVPCELCLEKGNEWGCIRYNCENSMLKSIGYALRNAAARMRRDYIDCVTRFVCITDFQRLKLIQAGYPPERITVIPNAFKAENAETPETCVAHDYVAYIGRLSYEKGADVLIEAARRLPDIPFKMAGAVRDPALIANKPTNVDLVGYVSGESMADFYRKSAFVTMPSRCYEGFPMAILEGAAYYKPAIGPDHGGFSGIIGRGPDAIGELFIPGNIDDLCAKIEGLWRSPDECRRLGLEANAKLRSHYSTDVVVDKWLHTLNELLDLNS